eukprot:5928793-Pleurochrysis_carterae.AAC.1
MRSPAQRMLKCPALHLLVHSPLRSKADLRNVTSKRPKPPNSGHGGGTADRCPFSKSVHCLRCSNEARCTWHCDSHPPDHRACALSAAIQISAAFTLEAPGICRGRGSCEWAPSGTRAAGCQQLPRPPRTA